MEIQIGKDVTVSLFAEDMHLYKFLKTLLNKNLKNYVYVVNKTYMIEQQATKSMYRDMLCSFYCILFLCVNNDTKEKTFAIPYCSVNTILDLDRFNKGDEMSIGVYYK